MNHKMTSQIDDKPALRGVARPLRRLTAAMNAACPSWRASAQIYGQNTKVETKICPFALGMCFLVEHHKKIFLLYM